MPLSLVTAPTLEPLTIAEARRQLLLNETAGEPAPTAPTVALISPAAAGSCDNGAWRIGFTFITPDGETELGPLSDIVTVVANGTNGKIQASNISIGGSAVTQRKAYAVPPAGGNPKYAGTLSDNTSTTAVINIAASGLGAEAPTVNTTADPYLLGLITAVRERGELATNRAFQTQTLDLVLDAFPCEGYIELPKPPLQSVTYVKYLDTAGTLQTLTPTTQYVVQAPAGPRCSRGRVALPFAQVWPVTLQQMGAVTVRFVCGYGAAASTVPSLLKAAMKLDLGTLYQNREGTIQASRGSLLDLPLGVRAIYWSYRSHATQRLAVAA